jgi:hypothetical protein
MFNPFRAAVSFAYRIDLSEKSNPFYFLTYNAQDQLQQKPAEGISNSYVLAPAFCVSLNPVVSQ